MSIDRIMRQNVPGYSYMKKAMPQAGAGRERKTQPQRKKPQTLTEIAGSGKAVLRKGVTVMCPRRETRALPG